MQKKREKSNATVMPKSKLQRARSSVTVTISSPNSTSTKKFNAGKGRGRGVIPHPQSRASMSELPERFTKTNKNPRLSVELLRDSEPLWEDRDGDSVCSEDKDGYLALSDCGSNPPSPGGSISSALSSNTNEKTYKLKYEGLKSDMKIKDVMIRNLKNENKKIQRRENGCYK